MPIIAIEGPDKSGKSTLINELRNSNKLAATYVQLPSFTKERMLIAHALTVRDLELWEALYNPNTLYICDRHVLISGAIYDRLYNRTPYLRTSWLMEHTAVLYMQVPIAVLEQRHKTANETIQESSTYKQVQNLYNDVLSLYIYRIAMPTLQDNIQIIQELINAIKC